MDFSLSATVLRRRSCRLRDLGSTRWGKSIGFLAGLHADTAAMLSKRIVRLDLAPAAPGAAGGPPAAPQDKEQQKPTSLYKVITNPVGFINHFTALQTTPDCKLILKEDMPLGGALLGRQEHEGHQRGKAVVVYYGPHHRLSSGVSPCDDGDVEIMSCLVQKVS